MRRLGGNALALTIVAFVATGMASGAGCSSTKPTELVPGVLTQVQVPRDLTAIRIDVEADGKLTFCSNYNVYDGIVRLPRTLGVVSGASAGATVKVTIRGYDRKGAMGQDINDCTSQQPVGATAAPGPRVLRRSIQTFVDQHVLFLPMPLSYSCFDQDCTAQGDNSACRGAQCIDSHVDAKKLVDFDPSLIDGTDVCFNPSTCFADAVPAVPVSSDATGCTFGFPESQRAGTGLNVRVFYQDYGWVNGTTGTSRPQLQDTDEQEILNVDDVEGFAVLPNQQFKLAPGLCALAKAAYAPPPPPPSGPSRYRTINDIQVASICPPKSPLLPICAGAQRAVALTADGGTTTDIACNVPVPLVPAPSAVYLVMDDSAVMHGAFGSKGYATAVSLSFGDPVFKRTFIGFRFLSHQSSECTAATTSFLSPTVDFGLAQAVQGPIADKLKTWMAPETSGGACTTNADCAAATPVCVSGACVAPEPLDLQAAMRFDAGAYAAVASLSMQVKEPFNVGAAMYFVNRTPDSDADAGTGANDCVPPLGMQSSAQTAIESEAKAAFQNGVQTYFVVLDNDAHNPPLAFFNKIQSDVQGVTTLDATSSDPNAVLGNFAKVVTALGTCSYEVPPGLDTTARLKFTNPLVPIDTSIGYDPSCDAAHQSTANGWNFDGGRVRICGCACQGLRDTILAVTAQALQQQMQGKSAPVPDVPVTATMSCQGAEAGAPSGGGNGTCSTADAGGPGGGNDATLPGSDASGPVGGDDGASGLGSGDTGAGGGQDAQVMDAGAVADSATE